MCVSSLYRIDFRMELDFLLFFIIAVTPLYPNHTSSGIVCVIMFGTVLRLGFDFVPYDLLWNRIVTK